MAEHWLDSGVPEVRIDVCEVHCTREETFLLFGTQFPGAHAKLQRRIILTPVMAKRLADGLVDVILNHEAQSKATPAGCTHSDASEADRPGERRPLHTLLPGLDCGFGVCEV